jgi:steroid 5-alpha reductase family enzyme
MSTPSVWLVWLHGLAPMLALALVAWAVSTARRNIGLVDIFWSLFILTGAIVYASQAPAIAKRAAIVIVLVVLWGLRLAGYLAWRNWNAPEDRRYQAIRARNEPWFIWKSLYLVFALQAVLAWLLTATIAGAIASAAPLGPLDLAGAALALFGIAFESVADAQLARFKAAPGNSGRVMDEGLWRYTRHPNYFGECCVWWGMYFIALGAGAWWTIFAPLMMTLLLVKGTGAGLLERDIGERRPAYRDYIARTNAFIPGPRRSA